MTLDRRKFLKQGLVTAGLAMGGVAGLNHVKADKPRTKVLGTDGKLIEVDASEAGRVGLPVIRPAKARQGIPGRKWVMVIDLARCDGCAKCMEGCSKMHFVPPDRQWIKVLRMQDSENAAPYFFPQPCYHCDNPPCTKVCPVDATFKRSDGIVLIDNERCIGCRFCMAACPYGARSFNWGHPHDPPEALAQPYSPEHGYPRRVGTVEKCDFCPDLAAQGKLPACVTSCPMAAIYYGDQNEDAVTNSHGETRRFSELIRKGAGYQHIEELDTQPRVYYLPPRNRQFPIPDDVSKEVSSG